MIYIVHGEDYSKSRKLIVNQREKFSSENAREVELENVTPKELYEMISSYDLFGNAPFIVLKIPTTKVPEFENYLQVLKKTPEKTMLIILCSKKLANSNDFIKTAQETKAKIVLNEKEVQANVFDFIDALFYKNKQGAYEELKKLSEEDADIFYLASMILYGLRTITHAKFQTKDFQLKSGFVKEKATRQAKNFSTTEIITLYDFFYKLDKDLKTGKIDSNIALPYVIEKLTG